MEPTTLAPAADQYAPAAPAPISGAGLPFTGLDVRWILLAGALAIAAGVLLRGRWGMTRRGALATFATLVAAGALIAASSSHAAVWHGHTVRAKLVGQIDASPCPEPSCLRGVVGVYVDGMDVRDHVVSCAWPSPRILDFSRRGYPHRHYAKIHVCGANHWWRFR